MHSFETVLKAYNTPFLISGVQSPLRILGKPRGFACSCMLPKAHA